MAILSVANLTLSIGDRRLLDGVSFTLDEGQHIGLVGRNGCGKSTLMKLIAGLPGLKHDTGQVQVARGASIGYLTQDPHLDPERTLRDEAAGAFDELHKLHEELETVAHAMATAEGDELDRLLKQYEHIEHRIQTSGGYEVDHLIDETLHGLGLTDEFFGVKVKDLSGGQKGRLSLAKLLLRHPDVLLLDEPTNHLDIAGRQWLEEFLASYSGGVVLVSHDRWLLDRVVSKIYEMELGKLVEYPGNYAAFREQRVQRRLAQQRVFEKQKERIKSEQAFIDRYRAGQRAAQAQGREKRLERYKRDELIERPVDLNELTLRIRPAQRCGDLVVTADALTKVYENKPLFRNVNVVIKRGERVGIIGPNGAGKSTLIRTVLGEQPPDSGTTRVGNSVSVGYYKQSHEHLNLDQTIVEYLRPFTPTDTEQEARNLAGAFLFTGDEQDKRLSSLSGGERSRAVLASLIVGGHNLLVLDEPTNHLDISASERLEEALNQFVKEPEGFGENVTGGGTLILITHDRMLLQNLATQLLILDGHGNVRHFLGNYAEYVEAQKQAALAATASAAGAHKPGTPQNKPKPAPQPERKAAAQATPSSPSPSAHPKAAGGKGSGVTKLNQQSLEERIAKLEAQLAEVDTALSNPEIYRDGRKVKEQQDRRKKIADELAPLEEEWLRRAGEKP